MVSFNAKIEFGKELIFCEKNFNSKIKIFSEKISMKKIKFIDKKISCFSQN